MARTTPTPADRPDRDGSAEADGARTITVDLHPVVVTLIAFFALYGLITWVLDALAACGVGAMR